jgi:hypothetical protein
MPEKIYFSPSKNPFMIGMMDGDTWEFFNDPSYFYGEFSVAYTRQELSLDGSLNTIV